MSTRWTEQDVARVNARLNQKIAEPLGAAKGFEKVDRRLRKYRNQPQVYQGQKFDSQRELECWKNFELQRIAGAIRAVIQQVSFALPGTSRRIRIDFAIVENDGRIKFYDAKGVVTEAWSLKRQQVHDAYGITIEHI